MEIRKVFFISICILLLGYFCFEGVQAFNNPNQGKYKTVIKKSKEIQESEVEPARTTNPRRKASENKRPWASETLLEMENLYFEPWDNVYKTMDWPKYTLPDGTRGDNRPDSIPKDWSGCIISAPGSWNIVERGLTYIAHINNLKGIIKRILIKGPARGATPNNLDIPITVYPNAKNGTIVSVDLFTASIVKSGIYYGSCSAKTLIENEECQCDGGAPTVYSSSGSIPVPGSVTLWVDSGGIACPPYTWTVSGTGYSLSKSTTENDLETVTLTLDIGAGTCNTHYAPYAVVTVTDNCGVTATKGIKIEGGKFVSSGSAYSTCDCAYTPVGTKIGCKVTSDADIYYPTDYMIEVDHLKWYLTTNLNKSGVTPPTCGYSPPNLHDCYYFGMICYNATGWLPETNRSCISESWVKIVSTWTDPPCGNPPGCAWFDWPANLEIPECSTVGSPSPQAGWRYRWACP